MGAQEENPLDAAARLARESRQSSEELKQRREAEEAATAQAASQAASELIGQCLDRLAQAGWPQGDEITVQKYVLERTGLLGLGQESRLRFVAYEAWVSPIGAGYRTGTLIGSMLNGEWAKFYRDSQLAIARDGTIWHGAFYSEANRRSWREFDTPSNETQVEALTAALGGILAKYLPA